MEEDKELNKLVLNLIKKCEDKKIVGINRVIDGYRVEFKFKREAKVEGGTGAVKIGENLSQMGDDITKTFAPAIV